MHILPNASQSKSNQTMKFGQLIEYNKGNIFSFFKNQVEKEAGRLVPESFCFLKKLYLKYCKTSLVLINIF